MAANTDTETVSFEEFKRMKLDKVISGGSYSQVYLSWIRDTPYAVKVVKVERQDKPITWDYWGQIVNETGQMQILNHPHLLKSVGVFTSELSVNIITPLMSYGSCSQLLETHFPTGLPEPAVGLIVKDILSAMVYLHDRHYIHNGIIPSHILIGKDGQAVLTGLGFMIHREILSENVPLLKNLDQMTENLNWLSPEILSQNRRGFTEKADVYSLGLTCIMLATGVLPFEEVGASAMLIKKLNEAPPKLQRGCSRSPTSNVRSSLKDLRPEKEFSKEAQTFSSLCTLPEDLRPTSHELTKDKFVKMSSQSGVTLLKVLDKVRCLEDSPRNPGQPVLAMNLSNVASAKEPIWDFQV